MRYAWTLGALAGITWMLLGCSAHISGGAGIEGVNPDGTPRWVNRSSGAYDGPHGKAFYGVGIARGIDNPSLLRQTVDNRARGEIAKIFDTYIAAMMRDYQRSTTAGDFSASAEEQDIVSAQKTITETTLRGVEIRDHWTDPNDGSLYALAVLDLDNFDRSLDGAKGLDQRMVAYVRDNARKAFEDLDRELDKRSEPPPPPSPAPPPPPEAQPAPPPEAEPPEPPARRTGGKVGLRITGKGGSTIQTCFANKLIEAGYALFENTNDVDAMVRGKLTYSKAGTIRGSQMVSARVDVRVSDMDSGRTSAAVTEKIKVGRPTLNESVQTAISQLCERTVPRIVEQIRGAIGK